MMKLSRGQLAAIHIAKKQLGLDDETYRDILEAHGGRRSASDLSRRGYNQVMQHFKVCGFTQRRKHPGRPDDTFFNDPDRGPLLRKIEAMLADAGRPWKYLNKSMVKSIAGVNRIEWCSPEQLHKIVAALAIDAKRRRNR